MTAVVIIVPVLNRPQNAAPLLESIAMATVEPHRTLFVCSPGDVAEQDAITAAGGEYIVLEQEVGPGDYARKINAGYRASTEPLLFLAADDLAFRPGWLTTAAAKLDDRVQVVGTNDLGNELVMAGKHSTHTLVTRRYCDELGTLDGAGTVLHEGYAHEYVDVEFVETAKARDAWDFAGDAIVEHLHPHWGKAPTDDLYDAHRERMRTGAVLWRRRRQLVQRAARVTAQQRATRERAARNAERIAARPAKPARSTTSSRTTRAPKLHTAERSGVTVVTASLPSRSQLLRRAVASVAGQTVDAGHLVGVDAGRGVAELRNRLVEVADTEWVAFLDDDDHLDPHHLDTLLGAAGGYDVVAPHCRFDGEELPTPACCAGYCNRPYDRDDLREHGIFPVTVIARRQAVLDVGGFPTAGWDDWGLWNLLADAGARFTVVPEVTWTYNRRDVASSRTTLLQRSA